ncbi:MAG: thioether cross-link-forming SCIFF peptide maturase [Butyricicoccus pullicaecorum]|uniref:thioether cross-link-forming SCIFF peptide maturase n=1 Tax=Butyricicoccus pullicaecorum TaxID=501571 RepID=UPI002A77EEEA|nr:thioether cross-link-forming SCIFF peptide maturase [Butyricicoccus pullicaecorum]MDY2970677.1 thioether cross-link-forming SCIFF peptide maturase [Butyricicoccus pullicaecorum]
MIHRFTKKGLNFLLDVNSGAVHLLDDVSYAVSGLIDEKMTETCPDAIVEALPQYDAAAVREAYAELYDLKKNGQLFADDDYIDVSKYIPVGAPVKALCLHVAHDCNLRCQYCFASTGDFGTGRKIMPFEVAKKAIDFVIERSGKRRNIEVDFFGGEPLMAWDTVKQTIDYARSIEEEHGKKFRFTITTNGLLLDDEKIDYINANMDNVVLSLDGRPSVNDEMRKTVSGAGSYDIIVPKFQKLVEKRDPKLDYYARGTFTGKNLDFAEDVVHIADEGFDRLSVEPVAAEDGCGYELTEADLDKIYAEYDRLTDIMEARRKEGKPFHFFHFMVDLNQGPCVVKRLRGCGAGYEYVAVTPEGDIYPCHQFVGNEAFKQGSVLDGSFDMDIAHKFASMNIYTREKCGDCWAKFYCSGGCSAANHNFSHDLNVPYEMGCKMEKKRLECAIYLKAVEAMDSDL